MGVTDEHPLYVADKGWATAGEIDVGDAIRNRDGQPLEVISVEIDDTPQRVHNLEIAEAHTYFAGELEAWGHNGLLGKIKRQAKRLVRHVFVYWVQH